MLANATLVAITWSKTLGIKRAFAQSGVRAPLTTLLVRDGTSANQYPCKSIKDDVYTRIGVLFVSIFLLPYFISADFQ